MRSSNPMRQSNRNPVRTLSKAQMCETKGGLVVISQIAILIGLLVPTTKPTTTQTTK